MSWQRIKGFTAVQISLFLALMLIVLLPFTGPRLPSALLGLLGGWLVWTHRADLLVSLVERRLAVIFALLLVPILLSIPASFDWHFSALVAIAVALYFLVGLALLPGLRGDEQRLWLAKWVTIITLVWALDGLLQYAFGKNIIGTALSSDGRVTGFFSRGNMSLSNILSILLPIPLWFLMRKYLPAMVVFLVLVGVVAVFVSSRNALVMIAVVTVGITLRLPRFSKLTVLAVVLVVAGSVSLSPLMQKQLQKFKAPGATTFERYDHLSSRRLTIWETAGNMFIDRPLTGVGAGMFARVYAHYSTRANDPFVSGGTAGRSFPAHNVYVSIAAESGLIGLIGIVVAFALCLKWYYAAPPPRREQAWPYAFGLLIALFPLSFEHTLYMHWFFPVPLLLLAAMLSALAGPSAASGMVKKV